jgi:hypothetical protein
LTQIGPTVSKPCQNCSIGPLRHPLVRDTATTGQVLWSVARLREIHRLFSEK